MTIARWETAVSTAPYATIRKEFETNTIAVEPYSIQVEIGMQLARPEVRILLTPNNQNDLPWNPTQPHTSILANLILAFPLTYN
jgi:hypothetical protein